MTVKPPKGVRSAGNLAGQVGLYPKERIGVVPDCEERIGVVPVQNREGREGKNVAMQKKVVVYYCRTYIKAVRGEGG